ncbi:hypothetical protein GGX14DRAFT_572902 [Mycena pura]|uniref:Uncharacterized protein n=1 Tax=Mycena pura TaxID=153505 RepID=A0AAD6Y3A9_9AGAR|nr:hypothetical protein GGX14DRAFT_572902 [Mycena pura]
MHAEARHAAREARVLLKPTLENAATCYLLDALAQGDGDAARPWAVTHLAHVSVLALARWQAAWVRARAWLGTLAGGAAALVMALYRELEHHQREGNIARAAPGAHGQHAHACTDADAIDTSLDTPITTTNTFSNEFSLSTEPE